MRKFGRIVGWITAILILCLLALVGYVTSVSTLQPPDVDNTAVTSLKVERVSETDIRLGNNHLYRNQYGNWELYLEGAAFERGVINGKLSSDLLYQQEKHFTDQIRELVPDPEYLNFLKYFVGFFNRNLNDHVTPEYQREIYGVSLMAPDTFDFISDKYDRMMNYHAAHDIGHALHNLALVGCTSFATDGPHTADGQMLVGRNFDFYAGDGFAENKIIALVKPDSGYAFLSVTWAGMIGVVSGMNAEGLTITLNAAPSDVPTSSATPISILAREILQYARTIDEAMAIAESRETFVSESLLISSAHDGTSALIEKTPEKTSLFRPDEMPLVCSNHFQSEDLGALTRNRSSLEETDSKYRYELMQSLLDTTQDMTPEKAVDILRHRDGLSDDELGLGNPLSINQLIAHHGVVFQPEDRLVWVSSNPYQLGAFAAYDLRTIFGTSPQAGQSMMVDSLTVPASPFLQSEEYHNFQTYRHWLKDLKKAINENTSPFEEEEVNQHLALNPHYYLGYLMAGEYFLQREKYVVAKEYLERAQEMKIPYASEREKIRELIQKTEKHAS